MDTAARCLQFVGLMMRTRKSSRAPRTLGDLIVAVDDQAKRRSRGGRDRRRLAALWVAISLIGSGNTSALRRLATV